ncbi:hypothetical protein B5807_04797 [Epicoccum nigrum]|uniref:Uncharacterized protein n=1 Tax=Epicoccum nigrum TaxID=105696 RepID=A0A1Y2M3Q4_EPING|nr:hypothetical protein B5807_04797 [Epicoccum nigrum]
MSQPRNYPPEANTQRSTRREKERHLPLLTPGVVPSQVEVRKVSVDHQGTRSSQQAQHHDTQRPLPVPPVELTPQPRNSQPETNTQHSTRREKERHPRSLTPGVAPSQAEVRNVPIDHRGDRPPQLGQHHDAQRPLPAPPAEPVVRNEPVDHRGARTSQQDQRHVTQRPLPAPPVEPTVTLPPFVATGPNIGGISRLSYFLWYGGGRPGGVQSVISHGARPADNRTVGQYIRRPALDPLGASVSSVEGLFELEAGVDPMAALGAAVAAFREEERNYLGDSLVRDEGPPVLPRLLVGDGSVDLDFASPAANELPAGKSDEQPAAEVETSAPIYELFARERDWDFDMDVVEQYKKGCGTNH